MVADLDAETLAEVQEYFGLPDPSLVEKDYWVAKALAAIVGLELEGVQLVFSGGTALGRAHRLIRRMSEDIDLKIISDKVLSRSELRSIRERVTERLVGAGFQFDPNSEEFLLSRNASKFTQYRLPYPSALDASKGLRAGIQIELTVSELRLPAVVLPVSSFVAEALGREPEVAAIPCATIAQTAAEKFVALTRRIGEERSRGDGRDDTLLRHVYDLHVIRPHYNHPEVNAMIPKIMVADAIAFGGRYRSYAEDPHAETLRVIAALREDSSYGERFRQFHQSMVYGEVVSFDAGLATLDEMAGAIATVNVAAFR